MRFEYHPQEYMRAWRMESSDGRLVLDFVPFRERLARSNLLVVNSEVHQMFGRHSGRLIADNGESIRVRDLIGFAEEHRARW